MPIVATGSLTFISLGLRLAMRPDTNRKAPFTIEAVTSPASVEGS